MKKILYGTLIWFWSSFAALAGVTCTVPYNLQNGTTADATQIMANYNSLIACLARAANAGANSDINSLLGLTTGISPTGGGSTTFLGGTSGGSANAQTIGTVTPSPFALTSGYAVSFVPGFSNTDATTLNVTSLGAVNVYRRTQLGPQPLVGGELIAGNPVNVYYDGTEFVIGGGQPTIVGSFLDYAGSTAPAGTHFADGSCILRAGAGAALFSVIGTTYDPTGATCDVVHFALPDFRGRVTAYQDNMGGSAANRITNAVSGCTGTTIGGAGCGTQASVVAQANLVDFVLADPGHSHVEYVNSAGGAGQGVAGVSATGAVVSVQRTSTETTGVHTGGSSTPLPFLNPMQIVTKLIQY